ncbi:MAG TPA: DUF748 domain-containing protein, partial [Candidatus Methylomirabilis sp.]|nr:DUF748 domain-containing protein [Candidatus Methylomirabilis sp.]
MLPIRDFLTRSWKKITIWTAALLAVFTLVGFFVIPPILKAILTKQLTTALHREVSVREVRVNPFALSLALRGLTVKERSGPETFASFEELYVNLESYSVLRLAAIVREVRLTKPFVRIVRHPDQSYNFSDLLEGSAPPKQAKQAPAKPPRFSINNIRIIDGGADFLDQVTQTKHTVREVNIGVPFISSIPSYIQTFVQPGISANVNGTRYAIQGKTKPFADSHETTLDVNIADLDLPYYLAYVPQEFLTFAMPSGRLDAKLVIVFLQQKSQQSLSVKGDVGFREIAIDEKKGGPVLRIPSLGIAIASAEPLVQKVHLAKVALESPELTVRRERTGTTNLETLLPKPQPAKPAAEKTPAPQTVGPVLDVDEISIAGAKVFVSDLLPRLPFKTTLAPIDIKVAQLSNRQGTTGTYSVAVKTEANEDIALDGKVSLMPMSVEGSVDIKTLVLKKYAPYYSDSILFDIESGKLDLFSRYRYVQGEKEPEIGASEAAVTLSALRFKRPEESQDFLRVATLAVKDTAVDVTKRQIVVGEVSTQKGSVSVKRLANGDIDLQKLTPPPPPGAGQTTTAAADSEQKPWAIMLKRLLVEQYTAKLEDRTTPEPITLVADKIRLTGENLSTTKNGNGKLSLALLLDQSAKISTSTTVGLDPLRADGRLAVAGVVLKRYAPYYRNMLNYDIEDGVLDVATGYRLSQGKDALAVKLAGLTTSLRTLRLKTRGEAQEFINIPSLAIKNTAVDLSQQDVLVGDLSTEGGNILVSRSRQGEINLTKLLPRATAAASSLTEGPAAPSAGATADKPARPWTVKAAAISVNGYRIQVKDEVPAEPVSLVVEDLSLKAQNLSTAENQPPGKVSLALRLDKGTVSCDGTAGLAPVSADLQLDVKEIDIRPFQPYVNDKVKVTLADGRVSTTGHVELSLKEPEGLKAKFTGGVTLGKFAAIDKVSSDDILKWESLTLNELSVDYNPMSVRAKKVALADFFAHVIVQP